MSVSRVASVARRMWWRAVTVGLFATSLCVLAPESRAQVVINDDVVVKQDATVEGNATVKGDVLIEGGLTVHDPANVAGINITEPNGGINMGNSSIFNARNITGDNLGTISNFASISGGTLSGTVGEFGTLNSGGIDNKGGGITNAGAITGATDITALGTIKGGTLTDGTATINGGNISGVGTITATTGNFTTVKATNGDFTTVKATSVKATNGDFTTLQTTGNANVGGDLTVTKQAHLNGGANIANHLTVAPGTNVNMGGNVVHGVADPVAGTDAANKQYVDAGLSRAFRDIDRNTQGIAIAMAMGGLALPDSKNFVVGANLGFFDSKQAVAIQGAMRLTPYVSVNGGVGMGVDDSSTLGGRVGMQVAW